MHSPEMSKRDFDRFRKFIFEAAGITLNDSKVMLVRDRLANRLAALELRNWSEYLECIQVPGAERLMAIDLLTTNETYFFREQKHFDLLRQQAMAAAAAKREFHVWSAACSSGEEPYSIAMVLADCFGQQSNAWSVLGTDISQRVLARAQRGHYTVARNEAIPDAYRRRYCLRGVRSQEGTFMIDAELRKRVSFMRLNLNEPLPSMQRFDAIFLRNVMIYFSAETKRAVVARLTGSLKPDGTLYVGHSESLHGLTDELVPSGSATYRRAA